MLLTQHTLAQRVDPAADCGHALAHVQIEPLYKGCIDRPATRRQDVLDRFKRAEHHPVFDPDHALAPVLLDDLRIEQPGQWPSAWLGHRALVVATLRVNPSAIVAEEGGQIPLEAITKPGGHTTWR
jgi:hypothetical protein